MGLLNHGGIAPFRPYLINIILMFTEILNCGKNIKITLPLSPEEISLNL